MADSTGLDTPEPTIGRKAPADPRLSSQASPPLGDIRAEKIVEQCQDQSSEEGGDTTYVQQSPGQEQPVPISTAPGAGFPDGGLRAWSVVAGGWLMVFTTFGFTNAFGVFQTYLKANQLSSHSESDIAWIGSLQIFISFGGSAISGRVFDTYGPLYVFIFGGVCMVLSQFMTSLCHSYWQFILAQGVLTGLGNGAVYMPSMAVVSHWFYHRRAFALGVFSSGVSIGGGIWPIVVSKLLVKVGFAWTLRIVGFIQIPLLIVAASLQRKRLPRRDPGPVFDLSFFRDARFSLYCVANFMGLLASWIPFYYIQGIAPQHGIGPSTAFYLVSILNFMSAPGRILPGLLADPLGPFNVLIPSLLCGALLLFCGLALTSAASVYVWTVLYGLVNGAVISLQGACCARICPDLRKIGSMLGTCSSFAAIATLVGTPIAGAIITSQSSIARTVYSGAFCFGGATMITGGIFAVAAKLVHGKGKFFIKI